VHDVDPLDQHVVSPASVQASPPRRGAASYAIWIVLLIAVITAVFAGIGDFRQIVAVVRAASWAYLLGAAAIEALFILNLALFMTSTFRASGVPADLRRFLPLSLASHLVNLVSKTGGLGGIALYVREARGSGYSAHRASAAYLVQHFLGYAAYFAVLIIALVLLYLRGSLQSVEVIASAVILAVSAAIVVVGWLAVRRAERLERLALLAARPVNAIARRFGRPAIITEDNAREMASELHEAARNVLQHRARYLVPFGSALMVEFLSAGLLFLVALALHAHITFTTALAVYAISLLFTMIAVTPAGLGFVEASLSVLLVSFGLDKTHAIAVTLAFRFFDFWVPMLLGAVSLYMLRERHASGDDG
jgi:uncharacterized protein (TIRG00374 family)